MIVEIRVKPRSSLEKIEKTGEKSYKIWTHKIAEKGRANKAVIELLSQHFSVPKSRVKIRSGETSRIKIVEIREGKA